MTDGPFRNAEMSKRLKRFADSLVNDAASSAERISLACDSMLRDLASNNACALLKELKSHTQRQQMELDPVSSADEVFERFPKTPFADTLQKHLTANLQDQMHPEAAFDRALQAATIETIGETQNRINEECIRARDTEDMSPRQFRQAIERNYATFDAIDTDVICEALLSGNKNAFKNAVRKKKGLEEGPDL